MKLAQAERDGHLYPDRHLNVFVPYRSHGLDYNVTRALVSTLRWSRPEVTRAFVAELAGVEASGLKAAPWHYDLQACDYEDFDPSRTTHQVVLGISIGGGIAPNLPSLDGVDREALLGIIRSSSSVAMKVEELRRALARPALDLDDAETLAHTLEELEEGSMPDGWVFSPEAGVCVLIEAKLTRHLDLYQLQRYAEVFFDRHIDERSAVLRRWEQVARFFAVRRDDEDPVTAFLCRQLHDYLDVLGLSGWEGFKPYDFDPDTALETLPKFMRFVRALRERAVEKGLPLGDARPSPTGARIALPDGLPGELAVDLLETGVRLELRIGDAPHGRHAGRAGLDHVLEHDDGAHVLAGVEARSGLAVRVERLGATTAEGEAFPDLETYTSDLDPASFDEVLQEVRRQHPPAWASKDAAGHFRRGLLAIGRLVQRDVAIGPGEALLERGAATLSELAKVARALVPAAVA